MKTLRTKFSYGMNERTENNDKENDTPHGKSFPSILGSIERLNKSRRKTDNTQKLCFSFFLEIIEKIVKEYFKTTFYEIKVLLNHSKKNTLK